ncbi:MAG: glycosyltransferase [Chromatiales bacterium]|nr:glycosyltransferase [Chromatiales bacterium]
MTGQARNQEGPIVLSIVAPVYNEEASLPELIRRCLAVGHQQGERFELVLVDDGSADQSAKLITEAAGSHPDVVIGVLLGRNCGQHAALMAGLAESRGDVVVTIDADLQNPPEEIPKLLALSRQGYDVVGSVRLNRQDSLFRRLMSRMINAAVRRSTGVMMHDYGCMLRAYDRDVVNALLQCRERSTFIPVLANGFASRTAEVEVAHARRDSGDSKYSLWKLINLQFDLLTTMTTAPLRLLSVVGALLAIAGLGGGLLLMVMRLSYGADWAANGVLTVLAIVLVFMGLQFIALGLLGEYIGRIFNDVRERPRYVKSRVVGRRDPVGTAAQQATAALARVPAAPGLHDTATPRKAG